MVVIVDQNPPNDIADYETDGFYLYSNQPNPFTSSTRISYDVPKSDHVILRVFDPSGHLIVLLVNENLAAGTYHTNWDGKDDNGNFVRSGMYFYELRTSSGRLVKKMMLLQ
jgi:flagellar hook assembly protein FlgD